MDEILQVKNVSKEYGIRGFRTKVLENINLNVKKGDFIAIMGPSGAGKTTLLNLMSTLDNPSKGEIVLDGIKITKTKNKDLSKIRRDKIGFIFQDYNLLDNMSLMDNIALPLALERVNSLEIEKRVLKMASIFGIEDHLKKYPCELSGGQKQRGSAARALIKNPSVVFADEPTGALDSRASSDLLQCLSEINTKEKSTIIMVTHDPLTASYAKEIYMLNDGKVSCRLSSDGNRKNFYGKIIDMLASVGGQV
ncbi:ABC transporter ATP-binding protein [Clostridium senegalense]|uniref:ABC transporter ATP-binding protein n=1 Tax=Clostridium senegalense TaxID=1465809 RepID=UPI000288FB3D|nr:ABC transporter ATP-binding protein [Clostridium senegalense]